MYENPLTMLFKEIDQRIEKNEDDIICHVIHAIGVEVDKDELIKALNYDREQYKKGYKEGYRVGFNHGKDNIMWIPVSVEMPKIHEVVLGINKFNDVYKAELYENCGKKKWYANGDYDVPIVAWLPLPNYMDSEDDDE